MARRGNMEGVLARVRLKLVCCIIFSMVTSLEAYSAFAYADELSRPQHDVILTVTGRLDNHNANGAVLLDRAMIEKIGLRELHTHTARSKSAHLWHGVLMRDLLDFVGAKGEQVEFHALDGYSVTIPIKDFYEHDVLLAIRQNGENLSVRRRGPTRIIYPMDMDESLLDPKYTARSVWQIEKMIVK
ncbi:molybdopterin-dependent oxidoreductase [uncultured Cohaesibacter sp.]|uniref:molybdopterin-dependent oxidoreductase n=1 Tax=uncultured Cohaesibacter sp. TaxID=1002546 RepID=UPI0029C82CB1|nr:molybdopterin-dependent oxidoreductase [uncultured Cohaesibacter sp.]